MTELYIYHSCYWKFAVVRLQKGAWYKQCTEGSREWARFPFIDHIVSYLRSGSIVKISSQKFRALAGRSARDIIPELQKMEKAYLKEEVKAHEEQLAYTERRLKYRKRLLRSLEKQTEGV